MKKIGFIDFRLDEWHANNYPAWIHQACEKLNLDDRVAYAWAEEKAPDGLMSTAQWCAKFGAEECATLEELMDKSDVLMILAPSNPEKHLPYAQKALSCGKPTYIDKTFAPDANEAATIFALSRQYGAPIFSTSALRYAQELSAFRNVSSAFVTGGGNNLAEYAIHIIEMIVCLMGPDFISVSAADRGSMPYHANVSVSYGGGRSASLNYGAGMPYTLDIQPQSGAQSVYAPVKSAFFPTLLEEILKFYETGIPPVSERDTMACMRLRDEVLKLVP